MLMAGGFSAGMNGAMGNFARQADDIVFAQAVGRPAIAWRFGAHHSETKWANQLIKRGWTNQQVDEAIQSGKAFNANNVVNKANSATRYVHPTTGRSVVIDDVTHEILHIGGDGFGY